MMSNNIVTFGCRLNTYESEKIKQILEEMKIDNVIVINTCAVTAEAERQARQSIRKLSHENPEKKIIVTGCSATLNKDMYQKMPEVHMVIENEKKYEIGLELNNINKNELPVFNYSNSVLHGFEGKARAFLQIQNGCNNYCSFCIIRIARGKSVSFPTDQILEQAFEFIDQGYSEINLTGVDISSFNYDNHTLGTLIQLLLKKLPNHVKLRLSSLDPAVIDESMFDALHEERLLPHWHLSLQSGDNSVLKKMLRRHTREQVIEVINKAKEVRPNIAFGADIITGFPTETDEEFENTYNLILETKIPLLHVFPYSDRPGTVANQLYPKIDHKTAKKRAKKLRELGKKNLKEAMESVINTEITFLIEKQDNNFYLGKSEHFFQVLYKPSCGSNIQSIGTIKNVTAKKLLEKNGKLYLYCE